MCVHYKCQLAKKITHASLYRMSQKSVFTYTTKYNNPSNSFPSCFKAQYLTQYMDIMTDLQEYKNGHYLRNIYKVCRKSHCPCLEGEYIQKLSVHAFDQRGNK